MLPALNHHRSPQTNQLEHLQDQLDFAARDIKEDREDRKRMREQLTIQNEIINKLYVRLNQLEDEQAESSKVVNSMLQSSLLQHQIEFKKQNQVERNQDIEKMKDKFDNYSRSIRDETDQIKTLSNDTHNSLLGVQDYLAALHQSDKSNGSRILTLESNVNAAMECLKTLQSTTARLQSKLTTNSDTSSQHDHEVTASLREFANCISEAKNERGHLQQLINNGSLDLSQLRQIMEEKIQKSRQEMENQREKKDTAFAETLSELTRYYNNVEIKISEEIATSLHDTKLHISALQSSVIKEKSSRLGWEQKLRKDTANVLNNLRQNLKEELSQYITVYETKQKKTDTSIKQLYKSIGLIEQSVEGTKHGLEHILQAEIKTRVNKLNEMEDHVKTVRSALGALDDRREDDKTKIKIELSNEIEELKIGFSSELESISNNVTEFRETITKIATDREELTNEIRDLETRLIEQLSKEIEDSTNQVLIVTETQLGDKTRSIQDNVDQIRLEITTLTETLQKESSDRQEDLVTISNELSVKLDKLSHEADLISLRTTIANCNDNVYEAEEKLAMMETTAEDSILRLNKLVDHLQIQIDEMNKAAVDREVQNNQPRDTPRDRGDTPRDHGDTPRDHGNTPRDHGNTPRDHGNTPRDTPTQQDDSNNNRFDHKNTETLIPEQL